jgi:hypothetical protein
MLRCKHPSDTSRNRACGEKASHMVKEGRLTFAVCEKHSKFYKNASKIKRFNEI